MGVRPHDHLFKIRLNNRLIKTSAKTHHVTARHQRGAYFKIICKAELACGSLPEPWNQKSNETIAQPTKTQTTTISGTLTLEKSIIAITSVMWPNIVLGQTRLGLEGIDLVQFLSA